MATTYSGLLEHLHAATQGKNLSKPSGGWDALSAFSISMNVGFPGAARENILRLCALSQVKGKFTGNGARWGTGYAFGPAWKEYITGATNPVTAKTRREERAEFARVARLWAAIGGANFLPDASE